MKSLEPGVIVLGLTLLVTGCASKKGPENRRSASGDHYETDVALDDTLRTNLKPEFSPLLVEARPSPLHPPVYSREVLPPYPEVEGAVSSQVKVRIDFVVGTDGSASEYTGALEEGDDPAGLFVAACLEVMNQWRFSPAWRFGGPEKPLQLTPYPAHLIFVFSRENTGKAQVGAEFR
jgi:hypothetical protein